MTIENIERKIVEEVEAEAADLIARAKEDAKRSVKIAGEEHEARAALAEEKARAEFQQHCDRSVSAAKAEHKLQALAHKTDILGGVFEAAVARFIGDRTGPYADWLRSRLASVTDRAGTILAARDDRSRIEELLRQQGAGGLTLADEPLPLRGGFILHGEKTDIDLSLDTALDQLRKQLIPELADKAFGQSGGSR